jgi:hypothetical protein
MSRSKLLVEAYYLTDNLHDDNHVKGVADAGIDFLVAVNAKKDMLDLCHKYNIGVYPRGNISGAGVRMVKQLESQTARNSVRGDSDARTLLAGVEIDGAAIAGCFKRKDGRGYAVTAQRIRLTGNIRTLIGLVLGRTIYDSRQPRHGQGLCPLRHAGEGTKSLESCRQTRKFFTGNGTSDWQRPCPLHGR